MIRILNESKPKIFLLSLQSHFHIMSASLNYTFMLNLIEIKMLLKKSYLLSSFEIMSKYQWHKQFMDFMFPKTFWFIVIVMKYEQKFRDRLWKYKKEKGTVKNLTSVQIKFVIDVRWTWWLRALIFQILLNNAQFLMIKQRPSVKIRIFLIYNFTPLKYSRNNICSLFF